MASFIQRVSRPITTVSEYLKESSSNQSLKYRPEKATKHRIFIPGVSAMVQDENGNQVATRSPSALAIAVHDCVESSGKYRPFVCVNELIRKDENGNLLNDGTCPACVRARSDSWDIYKYRLAQEEARCTLVGQDREKHMKDVKSDLMKELKVKEAATLMYLLVIQFRTSRDGSEQLGADGLPEYELKVMKMSDSRVGKINQVTGNAGLPMVDSEIVIEYPDTENRMAMVSQSTVAPVFGPMSMVQKYPKVLEKINEDVAKFTWEGVEKCFAELAAITTAEIKKLTDESFEKWDKYKENLNTNPNAQYLEYYRAETPAQPQQFQQPGLGQFGGMQFPGQQFAGMPFNGQPAQFQTQPTQQPQQVAPAQLPQGAPQTEQAHNNVAPQFAPPAQQFAQQPQQFAQPTQQQFAQPQQFAQSQQAPQYGAPQQVAGTKPSNGIPDLNALFGQANSGVAQPNNGAVQPNNGMNI